MLSRSLNRFLAMLNRIVVRMTRHRDPDALEWADGDSSWHNSSHELADGLRVIEHFEPAAQAFPDTLPAFHFPPSPTQARPLLAR